MFEGVGVCACGGCDVASDGRLVAQAVDPEANASKAELISSLVQVRSPVSAAVRLQKEAHQAPTHG